MESKANLATKLWFEGHGVTDDTNEPGIFQSSVFQFSPADTTLIDTYLKKNALALETFLHAAWGLLLNRLCTADLVLFGSITTPNYHHHGTINLSQPPLNIKSILNKTLTLPTHFKKIKTQLKTDKEPLKMIAGETRYLLILQTKSSKHSKLSTMPLDASQFPLALLCQTGKQTGFTLLFNQHLFSEENVQRIGVHFKQLIEAICRHQKGPACQLNLLTPAEMKHILHEWNQPKYDFETPLLSSCAHQLFAEHARLQPDHLAINYHDMNVSYGELNKASTDLTHILLDRGIKPGDAVCVLMDRTPLLIMAMLAVFKCGAIYIPINPKYPDERITYLIGNCNAEYILANDLARLPKTLHDKAIILDLSFVNMKPKKHIPLPKVSIDDIAYIIYTSGTTGNPKGVMIEHKSLTNLIAWYQGCFKVTADDRASQFASQGFDTYLCEVIPYLASGASVHIVDDNTKLSPNLFFDWLVRQKITFCDLPTSYAQLLFSMSWPKGLSLKLVKIGGESVTRYPDQILPFDIWDGYGPTESTIEFSFKKMYSANQSPNLANKHAAPPIGKPITHCEAYIVDKYLQPVPVGVCGELLIGGAGLSPGYLHYPELTNEKFIPHLFKKGGHEKLYRTGDLVRWLPNGDIEFVGRIDFQVKIRGFRIELGDIENTLSKLPDVSEVVVLAKENATREKMLVAYVVPNLERERFLYQERCLLVYQDHYMEAITEDLSKHGVGLSSVDKPLEIGKLIKIHLRLPGLMEAKELTGCVIWQQHQRAGIAFCGSDIEKSMIHKSIEHYLSQHNIMEMVLSASTKRNLRRALQKRLPDYMVPAIFVNLMQFPLTFSGKIDVKALTPPPEFEQIQPKRYVAPKTVTEKQLAAIWSEILKQPTISLSDNFFDLGGSSIASAELSVKIFLKFDISIPAKILFDLPYISILADYIDSNGKCYASQSFIQEDIKRDCLLYENISPTGKISPYADNPKHILLTGAGGFLGIYLLRELLKTTQAKIYCLIRKGEFESAAKRLMATAEAYQLTHDISLEDRRIIAIASDLSFDNFGLARDQYDSLVKKIDLIYHCGAQVNVMASYPKMRGSNVLGTMEVIKFATTYVDKPIHFISTLSSAYLKDEEGRLNEVFPTAEYGDLYGGYAISKWVSERLLTALKNRGLPITIYRSGYIAGQMENGMANLNDALLLLIKGCIQLGYAPDWQEKITILPVDYVSQCIVALSLAHPEKSGVYHLDHPIGINWEKLVHWINNYGYNIKIIPMKAWQKMLVSLPSDNALFPFLPYYITLPDNQSSAEVCTQQASLALSALNLPYPEINDPLLRAYFQYMLESRFIPRPDEAPCGEA